MMTFGFTLAACLIGSRIPDWIDSDRRPGPRGFEHSLLSLFISSLIALFISGHFVDQGLALLYAVALAAGYLSHLVFDFVTYEGVPWFWPLDEKYSLDLGPAGGLFVGFLGFLALALSLYLLTDRFMVTVVRLLGISFSPRLALGKEIIAKKEAFNYIRFSQDGSKLRLSCSILCHYCLSSAS
jgi:membrane-bound metal-dependent hydrolase YbcI (DUF457 family)